MDAQNYPMQVTLKHPIKTPNGEVGTITFSRLLTRGDYKAAKRLTTDEEEVVWHMICSVSVEKLTIEDTDLLVLDDTQEVLKMFRKISGQ